MPAKPGQALNYSVRIPRDHTPGLFWYHTHPHGECHRQVLDGMSGAIVIEGMERYVPEVPHLRERVIVVRGRSIEYDPNADELGKYVEIPSTTCGGEAEAPEEVFTVNGALRPQIEISPHERQFWRIVNASADRYLGLSRLRRSSSTPPETQVFPERDEPWVHRSSQRTACVEGCRNCRRHSRASFSLICERARNARSGPFSMLLILHEELSGSGSCS